MGQRGPGGTGSIHRPGAAAEASAGAPVKITSEMLETFMLVQELVPIYDACLSDANICRADPPGRHCDECRECIALTNKLHVLCNVSWWETSGIGADAADDRISHDRLEHRLHVVRRSADDAKNLRGRGLLLARLIALARSAVELFLQIGRGYRRGQRVASLGPIRALAFHCCLPRRCMASVSGGSRRCSILGKSLLLRIAI